MGQKRFLYVMPAIFILCGAFFSCSAVLPLPYLSMDVLDEYAEGTVRIPYTFQSEQDFQLCSVSLVKRYFEEWIPVEEIEEYLPSQGELSYYLTEGDYRLDFSVLSERHGKIHELSFLDKTYTFRVMR